jgi:integrase
MMEGAVMARVRLGDLPGVADLKYVYRDTDRHGNRRIFARRFGRKIRLRQPEGSEEFFEEYRQALIILAQPVSSSVPERAEKGELRWLVERYYESAGYQALDARTQRVRRLILDDICMAKGKKPYAYMETRHVEAIRDAKAKTPEAANARVKALRRIFADAMKKKLVRSNPALEVEYFSTGSQGWHTWTIDEVRQYEAKHPVGSRARLALALLLYTGARRSDVVKLGRQMTRNGLLTFTQTKNQKRNPVEVSIPVLPELQAVIDATPSDNMTFLVTEFGRPFTANGFGNRFRKWCNEAGLPHCSAHGLRKAAASIAAENGATTHQLMAIFGWTTVKQAEHYTRKANRKLLARGSMHFLSLEQKENGIDPLSTVVREGGSKLGSK